MSELIKVFVYGTLKKGFPNHHLLASPPSGRARFFAKAHTKERYPLVVTTEFQIPFLLSQPGTGKQICGEVYEVDEDALKHLDKLENHPSWYLRSLQPIITLDKADSVPAGTEMVCNIYLLPDFKKCLLNLEHLAEYTEEHCQIYVPTHTHGRNPMSIIGQVRDVRVDRE